MSREYSEHHPGVFYDTESGVYVQDDDWEDHMNEQARAKAEAEQEHLYTRPDDDDD